MNCDLLVEWEHFITELSEINEIKFSRNYCYDSEDDPIVDVQLHGFSDASEKAYGCCVYLRFVNKSGLVNTVLVTSKSRVSPIKKLSIPKLELMGTLLLARLLPVVETQLSSIYKISTVCAWTDSTATYSWILNSNKKYSVFVENRVKEIRKSGNINWKLIQSENNPADIISRGCKPSLLFGNSLWSHGPSFLKLNNSEWPNLKLIICYI